MGTVLERYVSIYVSAPEAEAREDAPEAEPGPAGSAVAKRERQIDEAGEKFEKDLARVKQQLHDNQKTQ